MANDFNNERFNSGFSKTDGETFNSPIDISDILNVCREYNQLGSQIQRQIEHILEMGVEEAISSGAVNVGVLPLIRDFLQCIAGNVLFGDASDIAYGVIMMLDDYEMKHPHLFVRSKN